MRLTFVQHRTNYVAHSAIHTFVYVYRRIVETFFVYLHCDTLFRTYLYTRPTSATIFFIVYFNHDA